MVKRCDWHHPNYFISNATVAFVCHTHWSQIIPWIFPASPVVSVIVLPEEGHVHSAILPVLSGVCLEMMSTGIKLV